MGTISTLRRGPGRRDVSRRRVADRAETRHGRDFLDYTEETGRGRDAVTQYTFDRRQTKIYGPPFSRQHVKAIYTAVKNPILTMATEESLKDRLFRNTDFLLDESNYPNKNFRCVSIKGGHDVHISNPERLAPFINEFLGKGVDGIDCKAKL